MSLTNPPVIELDRTRPQSITNRLNDPHVSLIKAIFILFGQGPFTIEQVAEELGADVDQIAQLFDDLFNEHFLNSKLEADNIIVFYFRSDRQVGPIIEKLVK